MLKIFKQKVLAPSKFSVGVRLFRNRGLRREPIRTLNSEEAEALHEKRKHIDNFAKTSIETNVNKDYVPYDLDFKGVRRSPKKLFQQKPLDDSKPKRTEQSESAEFEINDNRVDFEKSKYRYKVVSDGDTTFS